MTSNLSTMLKDCMKHLWKKKNHKIMQPNTSTESPKALPLYWHRLCEANYTNKFWKKNDNFSLSPMTTLAALRLTLQSEKQMTSVAQSILQFCLNLHKAWLIHPAITIKLQFWGSKSKGQQKAHKSENCLWKLNLLFLGKKQSV